VSAWDVYRLAVLRQALQVHVMSGGEMRLTRTATPTRILAMASEVTGRKYKRGQQAQALADMNELMGDTEND